LQLIVLYAEEELEDRSQFYDKILMVLLYAISIIIPLVYPNTMLSRASSIILVMWNIFLNLYINALLSTPRDVVLVKNHNIRKNL